MTETDAALPRETGQEKATATCSNCGGPVGVIETPYGSTAAAACPKCFPATDPNVRQQADASQLQRQTGTPTPSQLPGAGGGSAGSSSGEGGA